eukprot:scaffold467_cov185-Pinguiococcus_pyrenoidosus.AAC.1
MAKPLKRRRLCRALGMGRYGARVRSEMKDANRTKCDVAGDVHHRSDVDLGILVRHPTHNQPTPTLYPQVLVPSLHQRAHQREEYKSGDTSGTSSKASL